MSRRFLMGNYHGFTLLEVLTVITIIGLIGGLTVPSYLQTLEHQQLRTVADNLMNDIRYVQQRAMAEGKSFEIRFYQDASPPRHMIYQGILLLERKDLPVGITITAVSFPVLGLVPTVRFNYTGTPSAGGTVELSNIRGQQIQVITTPVTGRVRVKEF